MENLDFKMKQELSFLLKEMNSKEIEEEFTLEEYLNKIFSDYVIIIIIIIIKIKFILKLLTKFSKNQ